MSMYYPEIGEKAAAEAIVNTFHVINSCYAARWKPENDQTVRELFKALRIRPNRIELTPAHERTDGKPMWSALITHTAASKLMRQKQAAHEQLLD